MWANPYLVGLAHYRLHIPSCCQKSVQLLKRTSQLVPLGSAAKCIPSSESQLHTSLTEGVSLESVIIAIVCMHIDIQLVWPTQHRNWSSDSRDILGSIKSLILSTVHTYIPMGLFRSSSRSSTHSTGSTRNTSNTYSISSSGSTARVAPSSRTLELATLGGTA